MNKLKILIDIKSGTKYQFNNLDIEIKEILIKDPFSIMAYYEIKHFSEEQIGQIYNEIVNMKNKKYTNSGEDNQKDILFDFF